MQEMLMFWFAVFLAQLSAPEPQLVWLRSKDTPVSKLKTNNTRVRIRVTVAPDGKLQSCDVEESSGDPSIDSYTCRITLKRARFNPARSQDGKPAFGVFRAPIAWVLEYQEKSEHEPAADLVLAVNHLPKGLNSPAIVRVAFGVDVSGRPISCVAQDTKQDPTLVRLGCAGLVKEFTAIPARTPNGAPIASVQNGIVAFVKK